ncbi:hypothetical protein BCR42DRAFT_423637 [Absidia repens]|uniref:Uncharacterized protein n=1 Tax=Absidia repens TaxID=90262 RepID=A0A1X2I570_9FUNG|nr:hypothetical protein BCR42DRAFT_423637 [Absidia repens]
MRIGLVGCVWYSVWWRLRFHFFSLFKTALIYGKPIAAQSIIVIFFIGFGTPFKVILQLVPFDFGIPFLEFFELDPQKCIFPSNQLLFPI